MPNVATKTIEATAATSTAIATTEQPTQAPAPFVHTHADAGVTGANYAGLSSYLNANRKPRVAVAGPHKYNRTIAQLTPRTIGAFKAMRDAYGNKQFQQRGFDNAICAMLISAGLVRIVNGSGSTDDSGAVTFAIDGEKPLMLSVTAAGNKYGKA